MSTTAKYEINWGMASKVCLKGFICTIQSNWLCLIVNSKFYLSYVVYMYIHVQVSETTILGILTRPTTGGMLLGLEDPSR